MESNIDPIQFEVIRNTLVEATEEMAVASGNMAKMIYGAEKDAVGNGGGAV